MRTDYHKRLLIPLVAPVDDQREFNTKSGLVVARGYVRVVIGGRGPYVEFSTAQVVKDNLVLIPADHYYYDEYRTKDNERAMVYFQHHEVGYADYKPGFWYISPFLLTTDAVPVLVQPLESKPKMVMPDIFE